MPARSDAAVRKHVLQTLAFRGLIVFLRCWSGTGYGMITTHLWDFPIARTCSPVILRAKGHQAGGSGFVFGSGCCFTGADSSRNGMRRSSERSFQTKKSQKAPMKTVQKQTAAFHIGMMLFVIPCRICQNGQTLRRRDKRCLLPAIPRTHRSARCQHL